MAPIRKLFNQDYDKIKKQCEREGKQFVDPEFTPDTSSLYFDSTTKHDIVWKRPADMVKNPRLFVDGVSATTDCIQGDRLGNCWFVAACSELTHNQKLMDKVIPDCKLQNYQVNFQVGIFHFRFWRFNQWWDVVVDDFLPTEHDKLIYAHSKQEEEFWCALLEKAFAKFYGCYEALAGGQMADALVEVSGGVPEHVDLTTMSLKDDTESTLLFHHLLATYENKALIVAAIRPENDDEREKPLACGLVKSHVYAVSCVRKIELDNKKQRGLLELFAGNECTLMVRLHNPWGEKEWNGPWSDGSAEWEQVTNEQKKQIGLIVEEDGQFWMQWSDFFQYFTDVTIVHMRHVKGWFGHHHRFHESILFGEWKPSSGKPGKLSDRAGGCSNNAGTWLLNPQYAFDVTSNDVEQIMFSLTQKHFLDDAKRTTTIDERKAFRSLKNIIGMHVVKVEENRQYRLHQGTIKTTTVSQFIRTRTVLLKMTNIKRGRYVLIPSTFAPGDTGEYMLRVHSSARDLNVRELRLDEPRKGICCCLSPAAAVCRLKIVEARNLQTKGGDRRVDPYVIVNCESKKFRSYHCTDTTNPQWNVEYLLYRFKPQKPIEIEIWDANYVKDAFLGRISLDAKVDNVDTEINLPLLGKKVGDAPREGRIYLQVATYDDTLFL